MTQSDKPSVDLGQIWSPPWLDPFLEDVDPYIVWAVMTHAKGLVPMRCGGFIRLPLAQVLLEVESGFTAPRWLEVPDAYPATAPYRTATLPLFLLPFLLIKQVREHFRIQRVELGMAVVMPGAPAFQLIPPTPIGGDVIGVVDYGCPFAHAHFVKAGVSRVEFLWDQGRVPAAASGSRSASEWHRLILDGQKLAFPYGAELRGKSIKDDLDIRHLMKRSVTPSGTLDEDACYEAIDYSLMRETATHGAHVMDVAAGWPNPLRIGTDEEHVLDIAGNSSIVFVQLPEEAVADTSGGSMNVYVLDALRYIATRTTPAANVVVNASYGTFAGPHDGNSLLEKAIDSLIQERPGKFKVVLPAGNSFSAACHAHVTLKDNCAQPVYWDVKPDDPTDSFMELWYPSTQSIAVTVKMPDGEEVPGCPVKRKHAVKFPKDTEDAICVIVHVRRASGPYDISKAGKSCVLIALSPTHSLQGKRLDAPAGIWTVEIQRAADCAEVVEVDAWIERDDPVLDMGWAGRQSRFVVDPQHDERLDHEDLAEHKATKFGTLNTVVTGAKPYVVGGCRAEYDFDPAKPYEFTDIAPLAPYTSAAFGSGTGHACSPNLVAPSDRREALSGRLAAGTRSYAVVRMNGTSVAAPQVARALLDSAHLQTSPPPLTPSPLDEARWGVGSLKQIPSVD